MLCFIIHNLDTFKHIDFARKKKSDIDLVISSNETAVSNHDNVAFQAQARFLLDKIAPLNNQRTEEGFFCKFFAETDSFFDSLFDFSELNAAIESRNKHFGCCPDGIDYLTLLKVLIQCRSELLDIYNLMHKSMADPPS